MTTTVADAKFKALGEGALDSRGRLSLTKAVELLRQRFGDDVDRLHFAILFDTNSGEIVLVPETTIPLREAWLRRNPAALKSVLAGIEQAERGELVDRGSFAQYADEGNE